MDNESYDKKIFASNLRRYMEANDKKAVDVCSYLGVAKSTVSSWLNAEKMPRMDKVEKLANWLHIQKSDLIEEKGPAISEDDKALLERKEALVSILQSNPKKMMLAEWVCRLDDSQLQMVEGILQAVLGESEQ